MGKTYAEKKLEREIRKKKAKENRRLAKAFVKRKDEIFTENMEGERVPGPGWRLLAADLGDVYSQQELSDMIWKERRSCIVKAIEVNGSSLKFYPRKSVGGIAPRILRALIESAAEVVENNDDSEQEQIVSSDESVNHEYDENNTPTVEENEGNIVVTNNIRNEFDQIELGNTIPQVPMDTNSILIEEIKQLRKEIHEMKKDLLQENKNLRAENEDLKRKIQSREVAQHVDRSQEGSVRIEAIKSEEDDLFEKEDVPILLDPMVKSEIRNSCPRVIAL